MVGREGCSVGGVTVERAGWGVVSFPNLVALESGLEPKIGQNFEEDIMFSTWGKKEIRQLVL